MAYTCLMRLPFQIAIGALLTAVSMFLFGLTLPSGFLLIGAFVVAFIAPLAFLVSALSGIFRKD